jgi:hypothetical protein
MTGEPLDSVMRRLERLERENRRLKRIGGLAVVALAALGVMGQLRPPTTSPPPTISLPAGSVSPVIEAERFVLRDRSRKVRAELSVLADVATTLTLFDESGKLRVALTAGPAGGASVPESAGAALTLFDADGRSRIAQIGVGAKGSGAVILADRAGQVLWSAP